MIADLPILYSPSMILALDQGRKTQTRRALSPRNTRYNGYPWPPGRWDELDWPNAFIDSGPSPAGNPGPYLKVPFPAQQTVHRIYPLYHPGMRLWVRETCFIYGAWRQHGTQQDGKPAWRFQPDDQRQVVFSQPLYQPQDRTQLAYWRRNSIHMPRWASRFTQTITAVRLQRLQEISEADALAEGIVSSQRAISPSQAVRCFWDYLNGAPNYTDPRSSYASLWEKINGPGSCDADPWIVALTLETGRKNIDGR